MPSLKIVLRLFAALVQKRKFGTALSNNVPFHPHAPQKFKFASRDGGQTISERRPRDLARQLHKWQAADVKLLKLEAAWQPSLFPIGPYLWPVEKIKLGVKPYPPNALYIPVPPGPCD